VRCQLTAVHALDVRLQLLRLAELPATKVADGSRSIRVRGASVGPVHLQVVEPQEELAAELALVRPLAVVLLRRMLHDVVLAQHGLTAHLAVVLADGQAHRGIVEDGAVGAVVQGVLELQVAAAAVYGYGKKQTLVKEVK